uniref:Putative ovule protein n=1 Tax=Solanum chacoense TaxID=4108 RepID=A0A0V0HUM2_SOLCH
MIEAEGSNTNISKGVVLPPAQPSVVETDSPSYGSFTAEKKILKKKVEKDGEEIKKVMLTTPVRRSSRIRDRIGMSP